MASETLGIDAWIHATLTGDATITSAVAARVYAEQAEQGAVFPYIVFRTIDTRDVTSASADRIMVTEVRVIEAVDEGQSFADLKAIAERIDVLFHKRPDAGSQTAGSTAGVTILASYRDRPHRLAEEQDGRHFRRLGGIYRISAQ